VKIKTPVDAEIRGLVATMNVCGFRTFASCQGHGFPVDHLPPYIAFTASLADAARLARCLRGDAESPSPVLRWGWEVTASFDLAFRLAFRLHPAGSHHRWSRYCRRSLSADFDTLGRLLKSLEKSLASRTAGPGISTPSFHQDSDNAPDRPRGVNVAVTS
jgi:hypothetical protein